MSIEDLIESIGLSAAELKHYLLDEIDEFLASDDPEQRAEEFDDIVFALRAMAWAHTGRHLPIASDGIEPKVRRRLREYAALTRHPPRYLHDRLPELRFGVLHFAFGTFTGQWTEFDPLKNGTVAEIHLLTEAPFVEPDRQANQCIITFDDVEGIEYEIIDGAPDIEGGNQVLCRIPDFLFRQAKRTLRFESLADFLSQQVLAALDGLQLHPEAVAHFHSWESAFLVSSQEFRRRMEYVRTVFSPYLTVGPLKQMIDTAGGNGWTMSSAELAVAADQEKQLCQWSGRVVLESARDADFYAVWAGRERLDFRSFARVRSAAFASSPPDAQRLTFIAGGRPVREKGFVELCREFAPLREWAAEQRIELHLAILCRERRAEKGAQYIAELEQAVVDCGLEGTVTVEEKVSLDLLKRRMAAASAVIVPSLYDPYGLMATYAVEVGRPAFVSRRAGVAENILSAEFMYDPLVAGDLARAIGVWYESTPEFRFESRFPSYETLYLS